MLTGLTMQALFGGAKMFVRPQDVADRMSVAQKRQIFVLPIDAARIKAREIINEFPQGGYTTVIENWQQLSDGFIEFTVRRLPYPE
jgi:hypothetical protein